MHDFPCTRCSLFFIFHHALHLALFCTIYCLLLAKSFTSFYINEKLKKAQFGRLIYIFMSLCSQFYPSKQLRLQTLPFHLFFYWQERFCLAYLFNELLASLSHIVDFMFPLMASSYMQILTVALICLELPILMWWDQLGRYQFSVDGLK